MCGDEVVEEIRPIGVGVLEDTTRTRVPGARAGDRLDVAVAERRGGVEGLVPPVWEPAGSVPAELACCSQLKMKSCTPIGTPSDQYASGLRS